MASKNSKQTEHKSHMSHTVLAINMSISSFLSEKVRPMIDNWEKEIKQIQKLMKTKTKDERRRILTNKVFEMAQQTTQLQYDSGNAGNNVSVTIPKESKSVSDHMVKMTEVWKKQCKHLKDQSEKRQEIPNLKHGLDTLLHEMQWYLQYWLQNLTSCESKQQQERASVAQHIGIEGQQPQHPPKNVMSSADRVKPTLQRTSEASLTIDERQKLQDDITNLQMKYDSKVAENLEYKKKNSQHAADMDTLKKEMERLREALNEQAMANRQVTREKDEALNRLSEMAGQKLRQNNPAITDLSTENRPTRIAERFKELYTNQWTDAFMKLTENGYTESKAIFILLGTLEDSFGSTASISERQMKQLEHSAQMLAYIENTDEPEAVRQTRQVDMARTLPNQRNVSTPSRNRDKMQSQYEHTEDKMQLVPLSSECADLLKQVLKTSAPAFVPKVQQCFLKEKQANVKFPGESVRIAMAEFYKECAAITWFMNVQTPPLSLAPKPATGTPVQTDLYSLYTQSGEKVDYVVWPACLLHENGPLLTKGVVQPFKTGAKEEKENAASNGRSETREKGQGSDRKSIIDQNNINTSSGRKNSVKNTKF